MKKKEDIEMKDKRLSHLGEINLMDFQAVIQRYTADFFENQDLFLRNLDIFRAIWIDIMRFIHRYLNFIYLEGFLTSGFIPYDLAEFEGDSEFQTPEENSGRHSTVPGWRKRNIKDLEEQIVEGEEKIYRRKKESSPPVGNMNTCEDIYEWKTENKKDQDNNYNLTLQDLQILRKMGTEIEQYIRNHLDTEYLDGYLASGLDQFDFAEDEKAVRMKEENPHRYSCFCKEEGYLKGPIVHFGDIYDDNYDNKENQRPTPLDFDRTIRKDFHEPPTSQIMAQPAQVDIIPMNPQGIRLQGDEDNPMIDTYNNAKNSRDRQFSVGLKGLKDFAQLLKSNKRDICILRSYLCEQIDSETNVTEGSFSPVLPLEDKTDKGFQRIIRKNPANQKREDGIGFKGQHLEAPKRILKKTLYDTTKGLIEGDSLSGPVTLSKPSPFSIDNNSDTKGKAESYLFRNEGQMGKSPEISNMDLDLIMETLTQEINREYKRFYGSY